MVQGDGSRGRTGFSCRDKNQSADVNNMGIFRVGQFEKNGGMHNCESSSSKDHRNAGGEREIDGPDRSAP